MEQLGGNTIFSRKTASEDAESTNSSKNKSQQESYSSFTDVIPEETI